MVVGKQTAVAVAHVGVTMEGAAFTATGVLYFLRQQLYLEAYAYIVSWYGSCCQVSSITARNSRENSVETEYHVR